ncbi:hypothetical protein Cni_G21965 [Canna indica]|uniref:Uncharacterized protein n=1 Tax=Canna indica TaxID=4628 RepID=A0AAQ3KVY3_9LILI|nr:hypothetical protein Cni_G21965 [Canna indica]
MFYQGSWLGKHLLDPRVLKELQRMPSEILCIRLVKSYAVFFHFWHNELVSQNQTGAGYLLAINKDQDMDNPSLVCYTPILASHVNGDGQFSFPQLSLRPFYQQPPPPSWLYCSASTSQAEFMLLIGQE